MIPLLKIPTKGYIKQSDTISKKTLVFGGDWSGDFTSNHIIKMQIYNGSTKIIDIDSTGGNGITIIDANTFEIDEVVQNNLPIGCFIGDLQIEEYNDFAFDPINVTTYFNVQYTVIREYTKP